MSTRHQISLLWVIMIVCFLAHMLLKVYFYGSVESIPSTKAEKLGFIVAILMLPAAGAVLAQCGNTRGSWIVSLCLAAVYMALNLLHLSELLYDFSFVQMLILAINAVIGVFVLIYTVRHFKKEGYERKRQ